MQYKHNIYTTHKYCRRWAPEVKMTFIFFIGKVIFDKNLLKTDLLLAMKLLIDGICFCLSHQPALFSIMFNNTWWKKLHYP